MPGTGIALHNRASLFSLDPDHPNALAPHKRPFHTIIPALATKNGELWLSLGVMGRMQQAQGHLQVMVNMVDFGMNPQEALNALRFTVRQDGTVGLEEGVASEVPEVISQRGHDIARGIKSVDLQALVPVGRHAAVLVLSHFHRIDQLTIAVGAERGIQRVVSLLSAILENYAHAFVEREGRSGASGTRGTAGGKTRANPQVSNP